MEAKQNNPWFGLNTYTEQDRLYGRDNESREVADIVLNNLLTIIYGRSGIGKSSLLRAGVFPRMRYEDFIPVYVRLEHNTKETYLSQIDRKINEAANNNSLLIGSEKDKSFGNLCELLSHYTFTDKQTGIPKYIMLVLDQFEEIFTLTDTEHKKDVQDFFAELALVLNGSAPQIEACAQFRMVICLREDYLYFLEQNSSTIPSLKRNRYCLKALDRQQGLEVIRCPRPELVGEDTAHLVLDKIDTNHSGEIDPSILSLFMHELYEKGEGVITRENIQTYGDNIITNFYKDGIDSISNKSAAYLESRLVTTDGYRHSLSKVDAINDGGVTAEELDLLKQKRIITIEKGENNQQLIELSHDVLCPIALKSRNERKQREEKERLEAKAKAMKRRNRIIIFLLIIASSIIGAFWFMNAEIRKQRNNMYASQSRFVAEKARELFEQGAYIKALALLMEVCPHYMKHPNRPLVMEVYQMLLDFYYKNIGINTFFWGHTSNIKDVKFSPDGRKAFTISYDGTAIIWDVKERTALLKLRSYNITDAKFYNSEKIATISNEEKIIIWDIKTGSCLFTLPGHIVEFSTNGEKIAIAKDSIVTILDMKTKAPLLTLNRYPHFIKSVKFCSDENKFITTYYDETAKIWDIKNATTLLTLSKCIAISPNGERAIITPDYKTTIILNTVTGNTLTLHGNKITYAKFSPNGKMLATCSNETSIIWDVETGSSLLTLQGHINNIEFSLDCKRIITCSQKDNKKNYLYGIFRQGKTYLNLITII